MSAADETRTVAPDREVAAAFWQVFSPDDPVIRLRFIDQRQDRKAKDKLSAHEKYGDDLSAQSRFWPIVEEQQRAGYAVYYFLNDVTSEPGSGYGGMAEDRDVVAIRVLAIDDDTGQVEDWHAEPDFIVYTSIVAGTEHDAVPTWKKQALWRVADCPVAEFQTVQRRLAAHYGTDPNVINPSRIFRLPGSVHAKNPRRPYPVTFRRLYDGPVRSLAELTEGLPEVKLIASFDGATAAPLGMVADHPTNVERARRALQGMVQRGEVAHDGVDGNRNLGIAAIHCKRAGLTIGTATMLLFDDFNPHCQPPWRTPDDEGFAEAITRVYRNDKVVFGCDGFVPTVIKFGAYLASIGLAPEDIVSAQAEPEDMSCWGEPFDIFGTIAELVLNREMLPDVAAIGYAFDTAERQGADPAVTVCAMLATCAAAITDEIKVQRKLHDDEHLERAHANFLIAAGVGDGKSPAIKAMTAPLRHVQVRAGEAYDLEMVAYKTAMEAHKKVKAAVIKRYEENITAHDPVAIAKEVPAEPVKPIRRQYVIHDSTTEGVRDALVHNPRGLLNEQDEVTGFLASFDQYRSNGRGGTDRAFWLQTDSGGPFFVNRSEKADGSGGGFTVPNLSCCFIGGIQTDKLALLAPTLTDDGFIQRSFVIFTRPDGAEQDHEGDQVARQAYRDLIARLVSLGPTVPLRLSAKAHEWRQEVEQVATDLCLFPSTPKAMIGHLKKWRGKYCRLLLTFHVMECVAHNYPIQREIAGETARRARDFFIGFLRPHQLRFYNEFFGGQGTTGDARWIAGHILAHKLDEATARNIRNACNWTAADDRALMAAMEELEQARWIGPRQTRGAGSRETVFWTVNPRVREMFAERGVEEAIRRAEMVRQLAEARAHYKAMHGTTKAGE